MFQRFVIAYAVFTGSVTLISFAMMAQETANPWNPAWAFVSSVRNFCLLSWLLVGGGAALIAELENPDPEKTIIIGPTKEELAAAAERSRVACEENERDRILREERERKEGERRAKEAAEERRRQEELRREIEEKRKSRSAEEAARSGLDDFL